MAKPAGSPKITKERFDGVLLDLDGVITDTASVHSRCWKVLFDEFLLQRSRATGEPFIPFDIEDDYKKAVDGKLRYDGVLAFLAMRGIELPYGDPDEPGNFKTVCGLGNRKDELVKETLTSEGARVYPDTLDFVHRARDMGLKTAVVSSSNNCQLVLQVSGIEHLFDVRVDGVVATELNLASKPAPDGFLEAAQKIGVSPDRAAVLEDAIVGVQAGRRGGFALVIGVDRGGDREALLQNGADFVSSDLRELL